jgi:hypothetical protein
MMYSSAPACSARAIDATSFSMVQNRTFGIFRRSGYRFVGENAAKSKT